MCVDPHDTLCTVKNTQKKHTPKHEKVCESPLKLYEMCEPPLIQFDAYNLHCAHRPHSQKYSL